MNLNELVDTYDLNFKFAEGKTFSDLEPYGFELYYDSYSGEPVMAYISVQGLDDRYKNVISITKDVSYVTEIYRILDLEYGGPNCDTPAKPESASWSGYYELKFVKKSPIRRLSTLFKMIKRIENEDIIKIVTEKIDPVVFNIMATLIEDRIIERVGR